MRSLNRNKQLIYHSDYLKEYEVVKDEYGNETGEVAYKYSSPELMRINVSSPSGEVNAEAFGGIEEYDAVLLTCDMDCPIVENSRIWWDTELSEPHNYEVVKVSKSLNVIRYAIAKVKING